MLSPADVWAVGSDRGIRAFTMHWDGRRWQTVPIRGCCELLSVTGRSASGAWTADTTGRFTHAYQSRVGGWDGRVLRPVTAANAGATIVEAISAIPNGQVFLAGTGTNSSGTGYPFLEPPCRASPRTVRHGTTRHETPAKTRFLTAARAVPYRRKPRSVYVTHRRAASPLDR
jgi:hypothetical protein